MCAKLYTESTIGTPFKEYSAVLAYVNDNNPARARYMSRIEPEAKTTIIIDDFSGDSPKDIFASALLGIASVLSDEPFERAKAWALRNLGPRGSQLAVEDIAERFGRHKSRIYRWLDRIDDYMIDEFRRRKLIPDDPTSS